MRAQNESLVEGWDQEARARGAVEASLREANEDLMLLREALAIAAEESGKMGMSAPSVPETRAATIEKPLKSPSEPALGSNAAAPRKKQAQGFVVSKSGAVTRGPLPSPRPDDATVAAGAQSGFESAEEEGVKAGDSGSESDAADLIAAAAGKRR